MAARAPGSLLCCPGSPVGPLTVPLTALLVPPTDHLFPAASLWRTVVYRHAQGVSRPRDVSAVGLLGPSLENHSSSRRDLQCLQGLGKSGPSAWPLKLTAHSADQRGAGLLGCRWGARARGVGPWPDPPSAFECVIYTSGSKTKTTSC